MDALREMFPARSERELANALAAANGDTSIATERLLPPSEQISSDEAFARSLQIAEMPPPQENSGGWADAAKPVLDALSVAADAARAAVQYVVDEVSAAASAAPTSPTRTAASQAHASSRRAEDSAATVVTSRASAASAGVHLRGARNSTRAGPAVKKDD